MQNVIARSGAGQRSEPGIRNVEGEHWNLDTA